MALTINKTKKAGNILGLDVATRTGAIVLAPDASLCLSEELDLSKVKGGSRVEQQGQRMELLGDFISGLIRHHSPSLAVIEGYGFGNAFTLATLVELGAASRLACRRHSVPVLEVAPTTLKKFILGSGRGDKNMLMLAVYKKWGFDPPTDNISDAYGLARVGLCFAGYPTANKAEGEVLATLRKSKNPRS